MWYVPLMRSICLQALQALCRVIARTDCPLYLGFFGKMMPPIRSQRPGILNSHRTASELEPPDWLAFLFSMTRDSGWSSARERVEQQYWG